MLSRQRMLSRCSRRLLRPHSRRRSPWDNRIVPPIFVWMPESGAADIALDAELDAPHRVRGCAKLPIFRYKTVKNASKGVLFRATACRPRRVRVRLALPLRWLGRRWPRALRRCHLPAALLAVAAHATADTTIYHQNLLLQFSRKLSWLGGCLAPPCRELRPTPALCAPSRGYDAPLRATACHGPPTRCAPCVVADAALPTLFSRAASQRDCVWHRLAG